MDSTGIKEAMKSAHAEMTALEAQLAEADEGKKSVIAEMIEGKTKVWDALKDDLAHAEKREQIAAEMEAMEAKRNETEGKSEVLQDVVVPESTHNVVSDEIEHTNFLTEYMTFEGKVSNMLNKAANEKGGKYVESKMSEGGVKLPSWMAKRVLPTPVGEEIEQKLIAAQHGGKDILVREASGTNSGGGSLVEEVFNPTLFKVPKRGDSIPDLCMVKRAVGKECQFPKLTQSTNEYGVAVKWGNNGAANGEGTAITESNPVFTRVDVNLERISVLSQASMREVRENQVGLEAELVWMYQGAINRAISSAILEGVAGVANAPQGINTNAGTTAGVVNVDRETAAQVSYNDLVRMQFAVDDGIFGTGRYIISAGNTGAMKYIAALVDSAGRPVFGGDSQSGWGVGQAPSVAGAPYISTKANTTALGGVGDVIFGNFMGYGLCYDSQAGVAIERSDEYAFNTGLVTYRAILYVGGKILGGEMFSVLDDVAAVSSSSSS